eukprot:78621-Chlamydomonas_euryale.AAC.3
MKGWRPRSSWRWRIRTACWRERAAHYRIATLSRIVLELSCMCPVPALCHCSRHSCLKALLPVSSPSPVSPPSAVTQGWDKDALGVLVLKLYCMRPVPALCHRHWRRCLTALLHASRPSRACMPAVKDIHSTLVRRTVRQAQVHQALKRRAAPLCSLRCLSGCMPPPCSCVCPVNTALLVP